MEASLIIRAKEEDDSEHSEALRATRGSTYLRKRGILPALDFRWVLQLPT